MSEMDNNPIPDEAPPAADGVAEPKSLLEQPDASDPEPDWRDAVADPDLRKQLDRYSTVEDLTRHNLALRRRLSRAVTPPGEDADDEELVEFRSRMGVPESPEGYEYDAPGDLPDYLADAAGEQEMSEILEVAYGLGLTQAQLSGLMDWRFEQLAGAGVRLDGQLARAREESERSLRREWGRDYDRNLNLSRRALREFGGEGLGDFLARARVDGAQLANHPEIVKWAASAGRALSEGMLQLGGEGGGQSSEDRRAELTHAIHDARASGDSARAKELDVERRALTGRIYGE
jgi:hypothetical protein